MKINIIRFVSSFVFIFGMGQLIPRGKSWGYNLIITVSAVLGYVLIMFLTEDVEEIKKRY